jgi:hypothetical protein
LRAPWARSAVYPPTSAGGVRPPNRKAAIAAVLSELSLFEKSDSVRKVVAFIGLAPREFTSGNSIKGKSRLSKIGSARMRKALYMPSLVSMQCNPVIIGFSQRLAKKAENGKVIVCAVM